MCGGGILGTVTKRTVLSLIISGEPFDAAWYEDVYKVVEEDPFSYNLEISNVTAGLPQQMFTYNDVNETASEKCI